MDNPNGALAAPRRRLSSVLIVVGLVAVAGVSAFIVLRFGALALAPRPQPAAAVPQALPSALSELSAPETAPDDEPGVLPDKLPAPIRHAYAMEGLEPPGWRIVTTAGKVFLVAAAHPGKALRVSSDGHRLAYVDAGDGRYLVRDLPTGAIKEIEVRFRGGEPAFTFSPDGRFAGVAYGSDSSPGQPQESEDVQWEGTAFLDFRTGLTHNASEQVVALRDDGWWLSLVTGRSTTTLALNDLDLSTVKRFRVPAGLLGREFALAPDGRTLASLSEDLRLVRIDVRTGKIAAHRPSLRGSLPLAAGVDRWLNGREVLVMLRDGDDAKGFAVVDVRTGKSRHRDTMGIKSDGVRLQLGKVD
ncbi:hypothetical protein ACIBG7_13725 [Nonomuraea sp. NPDC050328]|uniref:hypothetical protein n=1 Tax=Nonomuraea sp. NPDC050328 TaxID=3364361 RepID=UPI00378B0660